MTAALKDKYREYVINDKDPNLYRIYRFLKESNAVSKLVNAFKKLRELGRKYGKSAVLKKIKEALIKVRKSKVPPQELLAIYILYLPLRGAKGGMLRMDVLKRGLTKLRQLKYKILNKLMREKNIEVKNEDALKLIKQNDKKGTVFYLDPPYATIKRLYKNEFTPKKAEELAKTLTNLKHAKFVLKLNKGDYLRYYRKYLPPNRYRVVKLTYTKSMRRIQGKPEKGEYYFIIKS